MKQLGGIQGPLSVSLEGPHTTPQKHKDRLVSLGPLAEATTVSPMEAILRKVARMERQLASAQRTIAEKNSRLDRLEGTAKATALDRSSKCTECIAVRQRSADKKKDMQERYQHWLHPRNAGDLYGALQKKDYEIATLRQTHKAALERQQRQHERYLESLQGRHALHPRLSLAKSPPVAEKALQPRLRPDNVDPLSADQLQDLFDSI